jgi:hypothetical protein
MLNVESQIEASLEQLQMDERLRSNLMDPEASLIFDWAVARLTESAASITDESAGPPAVRTETRRVRSMLRQINDLFDDNRTPTPLEAVTALNLPLAQTDLPARPDRSALIRWLLDQLALTWHTAAS